MLLDGICNYITTMQLKKNWIASNIVKCCSSSDMKFLLMLIYVEHTEIYQRYVYIELKSIKIIYYNSNVRVAKSQ